MVAFVQRATLCAETFQINEVQMLKMSKLILFFCVHAVSAEAQTLAQSNGGFTQCSWTDAKGHSGNTMCHILEQGTHMGETTRLMTVNNPRLAYLFMEEKHKVDLIHLQPGRNRSIWRGHFFSTYDKRDSMLETLHISDGVTIRIRNF